MESNKRNLFIILLKISKIVASLSNIQVNVKPISHYEISKHVQLNSVFNITNIVD